MSNSNDELNNELNNELNEMMNEGLNAFNKEFNDNGLTADEFWIDEIDTIDTTNKSNIDEFWDNKFIIDNDDSNLKSPINNKLQNYIENNWGDSIKITESDTNMLEIELVSKLNNKMSKDKKMSLMIVVLLQIIFKNDDTKLKKIYNFLNKNNLLDLDVITNNYSGLRQNLSSLINSTNIINDVKTEQENDTKHIDYIEHYINNGNFNLSKNDIPNIILTNNKYRTNFNQIKLIGQGAYGSVYKVFHKYEKKFYAIKKVFITKDIIKDNYDIFREIEIYSDLMNDNVVRYYGSWIDIDIESIIEYNNQIMNDYEFDKIDYVCPTLFIQMELCDFTLKEYLLTWSEHDSNENKIDILIQIFKGLKYLNTKNIVHRDIKPDNIFLLNTSNSLKLKNYLVKIGDFGLCKKYESNEKNEKNNYYKHDENNYKIQKNNCKSMGEFIGTGIYMAPEIYTKKYDYSIDIYSIGIMMVELFINFTTQSEKISVVSKLKKSFDINLLDRIDNDNIKELISIMVNSNPIERPNIDLILIKLNDCLNKKY